MKSGTYHILFLLLSSCICFISTAQIFKAGVDRSRILIGEQIQLTFRLEGLRTAEGSLNNWVEFPDSVNHVEVVERGKIDTIQVSQDVTLQQTIAITSFDSGQWTIPAIKLAVNGRVMATQPITIDVLPVDVSQLHDYHDIKDIVEVKNKYSLWILIGIAVITLLSLIAIYKLARKRSNYVPGPKPVLKGKQTPIEWALSSLDALQKEDLPGRGKVKQYYQRLTDICRQYFQLQLHEKALQQTSDEWIMKMQPLPVESSAKTSFFQFIRLADAVKFAKYLPPIAESEQSMNVAKHMLMEVANTQQTIPTTNKITVS